MKKTSSYMVPLLIALISADNPASSACGEFKEGSSAYRFCRQCLSTADESKEIVSLKFPVLLTRFVLL